jgi:hypothetical protein
LKNLNRFIFSAGTLAFLCGFSRADIVMQLDTLVTGFTPGGTAPWATLTIEDAGTDTVNFTLLHSANSSSGQFIRTLWLNMDPFPANPQMVETSPSVTGVSFDENGINDAGVVFDVQVDFEAANAGGNRLDPGESVTWQFTGTGINENAFDQFSGGNTQVLAMAHIQGIEGELSGKVGAGIVPEPASMGALAIGALALLRRRKK